MKPARAAAPRRGSSDWRRTTDLARIHCLKRDLQLDDDTYRLVLWTVARVESAKALDSHGRQSVIEHMQARMPKAVAKPKAAKSYPNRPHNAEAPNRAELLKIEALLTDAGKPWNYALAMLKQMTGGKKQKMEFASPEEMASIIAALHKAACKRLPVELEAELGPEWLPYAEYSAKLLFGFDPVHRNLASYPQAMSQVLRWHRGKLQVSCMWPAMEKGTNCCSGCRLRAHESSGQPASV